MLSIIFFYDVGAVGDRKPKPSSEEETLAMESVRYEKQVFSEKESPVEPSNIQQR